MRSTLLILLPLFAGCPGGTSETDEPAVITWEAALEDDDRGAYLMAWHDGASEVWVVGGQPEAGIVLKGTASSLQAVALPEDTPLLNWVHGTGPDDVWVGGLSGTVLHWDGTAWEDRSLPIEEAVWGVHAVSATEVWAVGGTSAWGGEAAQIHQWSGGAWTSPDLPEVLDGLGNLFKAFDDGTDLWACGFQGAVVRTSDGQRVDAVATGYAQDIVTVHGLPGQDPIFVGGRGTGAILEVDGEGLSVAATARSGLSGVHVMDDGRAVVVGERGFAGLYDPSTDELIEAEVLTEDVLHGVVVDGDGRIWAAGGNLYTAGDAFLGSVWVGTMDDGGGE